MWWKYIVAAAVVLFVIYAFVSLTGFEKRWLTRKTSRTAKDMYNDHADTSGPPSHRGRRGDEEQESHTPPRRQKQPGQQNRPS